MPQEVSCLRLPPDSIRARASEAICSRRSSGISGSSISTSSYSLFVVAGKAADDYSQHAFAARPSGQLRPATSAGRTQRDPVPASPPRGGSPHSRTRSSDCLGALPGPAGLSLCDGQPDADPLGERGQARGRCDGQPDADPLGERGQARGRGDRLRGAPRGPPGGASPSRSTAPRPGHRLHPAFDLTGRFPPCAHRVQAKPDPRPPPPPCLEPPPRALGPALATARTAALDHPRPEREGRGAAVAAVADGLAAVDEAGGDRPAATAKPTAGGSAAAPAGALPTPAGAPGPSATALFGGPAREAAGTVGVRVRALSGGARTVLISNRTGARWIAALAVIAGVFLALPASARAGAFRAALCDPDVR